MEVRKLSEVEVEAIALVEEARGEKIEDKT